MYDSDSLACHRICFVVHCIVNVYVPCVLGEKFVSSNECKFFYIHPINSLVILLNIHPLTVF